MYVSMSVIKGNNLSTYNEYADSDHDEEGNKNIECNVSVIICQLPGSINIKMCTAMIYE